MNSTGEMNSTMKRENHLTEEQFYELLGQPGLAGEAQVHLAACQRCATELGVMRQSLDGFKLAATGLAEATMPPVRAISGKTWSGFRVRLMAWPLGLAMASALLAASVTLVHRAGPAPQVQVGSVAAAPLDSDEALLDGIDQDLSTSVAPSLAPLAVTSGDAAAIVSKRN